LEHLSSILLVKCGLISSILPCEVNPDHDDLKYWTNQDRL